MWDTSSQIIIFIFGTSSIILVAQKNKRGFVLGLLASPFWFITSLMNRQWGIFFLNFAYTLTWIDGIHEWFFKDGKKAQGKKNTRKVKA